MEKQRGFKVAFTYKGKRFTKTVRPVHRVIGGIDGYLLTALPGSPPRLSVVYKEEPFFPTYPDVWITLLITPLHIEDYVWLNDNSLIANKVFEEVVKKLSRQY